MKESGKPTSLMATEFFIMSIGLILKEAIPSNTYNFYAKSGLNMKDILNRTLKKGRGHYIFPMEKVIVVIFRTISLMEMESIPQPKAKI